MALEVGLEVAVEEETVFRLLVGEVVLELERTVALELELVDWMALEDEVETEAAGRLAPAG